MNAPPTETQHHTLEDRIGISNLLFFERSKLEVQSLRVPELSILSTCISPPLRGLLMDCVQLKLAAAASARGAALPVSNRLASNKADAEPLLSTLSSGGTKRRPSDTASSQKDLEEGLPSR